MAWQDRLSFLTMERRRAYSDALDGVWGYNIYRTRIYLSSVLWDKIECLSILRELGEGDEIRDL